MFSLHLIHRTGLRLAAFIQRFIWRTKLWNCLSKVNVIKWRGRHSASRVKTRQHKAGKSERIAFLFLLFGGPVPSFKFPYRTGRVRNANYLADIQGWIMHLVIRSGTWALVGNTVYIIVTDGIRQQQSQSSPSAARWLAPWTAELPCFVGILRLIYAARVASLSNINVTRNVKVLFWLRETRPHRPLAWSSHPNVSLLCIPILEQFPTRLRTYIL